VLNGLKKLYKRLSASAALLSGLRAHDEQIAQLRAAIATLMSERPGLSPAQKEAAKAKIEGLFAYQALSKDETERLRALYESGVARVAGTEIEIAALRERLDVMEESLRKQGGRT
jgi:hypothetical protein